MDEVRVREAIRQFILTSHLHDETAEDLPDDLPLRTSGILDSFATMGLVTFIEQELGVELDVYDTSVERFNRIDEMAAVVLRKQGDRAGVPLAAPHR